MNLLIASNISKAYGERKALNNFSFSLNNGDLCVLVGENGAGKTTLIKLMAGVLHSDCGDILIDNISLFKNPVEYKKKISYVPDSLYLYEYMNLFEFLNFVANVYEVDVTKRKANIDKYVTEFGLKNNMYEPIYSFSRGMKQKVLLISAFIHPAEVYILDEPFSGLDPKSVAMLKKTLKNKIDKGKTVLFSTHLLDVAEKIFNRVVVLKKGDLIIDKYINDFSDMELSFEKFLLEVIENENDKDFD